MKIKRKVKSKLPKYQTDPSQIPFTTQRGMYPDPDTGMLLTQDEYNAKMSRNPNNSALGNNMSLSQQENISTLPPLTTQSLSQANQYTQQPNLVKQPQPAMAGTTKKEPQVLPIWMDSPFGTNEGFTYAGRGFGALKPISKNENLTPEQKKDYKALAITEGISGTLAGGFGMARDFMSGFSSKRENQFLSQEAVENQLRANRQYNRGEQDINANRGYVNSQNGGIFQAGGEVPIEEMLSDRSVKGLPEEMEGVANAELESKEFLISQGDISRVEGKRHSEGGEKFALKGGDKIISDNILIGKQLDKFFDDMGLNTNPKNSFATVMEKFRKKIGMTELQKEQEVYFKKLEKNAKLPDSETKIKNEEFISSQINEIEEQKEDLKALESFFADVVYNKQEDRKKEGGNIYKNKVIEQNNVEDFDGEVITARNGAQFPVYLQDGGIFTDGEDDNNALKEWAKSKGFTTEDQIYDYLSRAKSSIEHEEIDKAISGTNRANLESEFSARQANRANKLDEQTRNPYAIPYLESFFAIKQNGGEQANQIMQEIASALQQGASPEEIIQALVQQGASEEQAAAMIEQVTMQMQQQPMMQQGGEQENQLMQEIASALQQGASPEEVVSALIQQGASEEQAMAIVEQVTAQMQQQPMMQQGGEQDVMTYISDSLQQGVDPQEIMTSLVEQGLQEEEVTAAIQQVMAQMQQPNEQMMRNGGMKLPIYQNSTAPTPPYDEQDAYTEEGVARLNRFLKEYNLKELPKTATKSEVKDAASAMQKKALQINPELVTHYLLNQSHQAANKFTSVLDKKYGSAADYKKDWTQAEKQAYAREKYKTGDLKFDELGNAFNDALLWYRSVSNDVKAVPRPEYEKFLKDNADKLIKQADASGNPLYYLYKGDGQYEALTPYDVDTTKKDKEEIEQGKPGDMKTWQAAANRRRSGFTINTPVFQQIPTSMLLPGYFQETPEDVVAPKVSSTEQIAAITGSARNVAGLMSGTSGAEKMANLAYIQAKEAEQINRAKAEENRLNVASEFQAKQANAANRQGVQARNISYAIPYVDKANLAQINTEQEWQNYFAKMSADRARALAEQRALGVYESMTPDFSYNTSSGITYDPNGNIVLSKNDPIAMAILSSQNKKTSN